LFVGFVLVVVLWREGRELTMPPYAKSRRLSLRKRMTMSSTSSSTTIVLGWRRCLCGDREVLVTSQSARNLGRLF